MAILRFKALDIAWNRNAKVIEPPKNLTSEYFGINVFDKKKMEKYLSNDAYEHVIDSIENGTPIDRKMASLIAIGMKAWALDRGVTHFTHWFQPLTGGTAEKHDAFIDRAKDGTVVEMFSGESLAQQEPDASSFPHGGIRNTFEARGYTAWDPSSPAFIIGNTLSIPTIFISYTGESLDHKTPLLKSLQSIDKAATEVAQYFDKNVSKVYANLGWEQEYFLIDEALYMARPDLSLTGRTLMGHASAKDQQLDDHYFGSIPERVKAFMVDLEIESYKLGIPLKTRHNEVAPNQYEAAPYYEECNLAVDHNALFMDLMQKLSGYHNFKVLFHEKPFKGINGSGKHNNWSLITNTGVILHKPGKNPRSNMQFLTFLVNTIKAVYDNQDLLRASISSASNSHRLGANEAPPAIMSCFLGDEVSKMLTQIEMQVSDKKMTPDEKTALKLDVGKIPEILLDNTDRNRTSPFAFTGNRFEFRAVGSYSNCASPMVALNTAVASQLINFKKEVDELIEKGVKKDEAIFQMIRKTYLEAKNVIFEGDGYSDDWLIEAEKRGLSNITNVPDALKQYASTSSIELFKNMHVLSEIEVESRLEVMLEDFTMKVQIESRVFGDLAINHIVPIAVQYQNRLLENIQYLKNVTESYNEFTDLSGNRMELVKDISDHIKEIKKGVFEMIESRKEANSIKDAYTKAKTYSESVSPYLNSIRYHIDKLELIVDDEIWPLPKYRELLFIS